MATFKRNYDEDPDLQESAECPFSFTMGGQEWHCRSVDDIPWATVEEFFLAQASGNIAGVVMEIDDLCRAVLMSDEVEDFLEMKHDPDAGFTYRKFSALLEDLVREVFGTPTRQPAPSRRGSSKSERSSEGGSLAKASRSRKAS